MVLQMLLFAVPSRTATLHAAEAPVISLQPALASATEVQWPDGELSLNAWLALLNVNDNTVTVDPRIDAHQTGSFSGQQGSWWQLLLTGCDVFGLRPAPPATVLSQVAGPALCGGPVHLVPHDAVLPATFRLRSHAYPTARYVSAGATSAAVCMLLDRADWQQNGARHLARQHGSPTVTTVVAVAWRLEPRFPARLTQQPRAARCHRWRWVDAALRALRSPQ